MPSAMKHPSVAAGAVSLLAFLLYIRTLAPGLSFIDSGELGTVAATLGVAHPTGYPLFTLLGWLFTRLPLASEVIVRLNIMAAVFCAGGVFVFFFVQRHILALSSRHGLSLQEGIVVPAAGSLLLAFSETYWMQAISVEVYSLHILLTGLLLLTFLRANFPLPAHRENIHGTERTWYLFAFLVGLSFTNHMTTVLLAPGLLFLYFVRQGGGAGAWGRLARMSIPFAGGLSLYAYLPIRASQSPMLNWGNAVTLERFLWHVTGKQYQVWIFSSTDVTGRQLAYFFQSFPAEFAYVGMLAAAIGLIAVGRAHRQLAVGMLLLFLCCVAYAINYDIHDIDSYFLLAYITTALLASRGFLTVYRWIAGGEGRRRLPASVFVLLLGAVPLAVHYRSVDESENHLVDDYTMNVFDGLDEGAVVLSYQWDYWVSASYYVQHVKGIRRDVTVIDKELLRRSWYLKELESRAPWLWRMCQAEVDAFARELDKFEHGLPYDGGVIEARYTSMIRAFIVRGMQAHHVYVTPEIEQKYTQGFQRVPSGLAFLLLPTSGYTLLPAPVFHYRPFERRGRLEDTVRRLYAEAWIARSEYAFFVGKDLLEARKSLENGLKFDPTTPQARRIADLLRNR